MFTARAAEHLSSPRNAGPLTSATHYGEGGTPGEGPYSRLWLQVEQGRIVRAGYECNGCPSSIVTSSMVAEIVTGRTVEQAALLTPADVVLLSGGLPEGKGYYADLAVAALQSALKSEVTN